MASFTFNNSMDIWPVGSVVGVYLGSQLSSSSDAPAGNPLQTQTMGTGGAITFTGLQDGASFVAASQVAGVWRSIRFRIDPVTSFLDQEASGIPFLPGGSVSASNVQDAIEEVAADYEAAVSGKADAVHTHAQSDVTGLVADLAGKAAATHTHAQADVTGLVTALAGKAAATHTHAQSDVTNLTTDLAARATEATRSASGKGFVNHGATAGTARPSGYASVEWVGSVEPTNALNGDTWWQA